VSRKILKSLLARLGYEMKKLPSGGLITAQRQTMAESLAHLKKLGYRPDWIIDVGAADGTLPLLAVFPEARHLLAEPLTEYEPQLQALTTRYAAIYRIAAVADHNGRRAFNVHHGFLQGSSLYQERDGAEYDGSRRDVECVTLDTLIDAHRMEGGILLKVDTQGSELLVMKGLNTHRDRVDAIILEVSLFSFLVSSPEFHDVVATMAEAGFVVYDMFDGYNRPLDGALASVDVLFVKKDGRFRSLHNWATAEQRRGLVDAVALERRGD
jgi:FkbM family methyltransferase